jgi:hypothetical protein
MRKTRGRMVPFLTQCEMNISAIVDPDIGYYENKFFTVIPDLASDTGQA